MISLDAFDRKILKLLQQDATVQLEEIAAAIGLSASPCWRRIKRLEAEGVIRGRVALLDRKRLNLGVTVFVAVRTNQHTPEWLETFSRAVDGIPEIVELYRMSGQIDYLLKVVVPDIGAYDAVYKQLIGKLPLFDVSSMFAMEEIKATHVLPLDYLGG
jgi:Lrp/AsnC family transcriptional regulator